MSTCRWLKTKPFGGSRLGKRKSWFRTWRCRKFSGQTEFPGQRRMKLQECDSYFSTNSTRRPVAHGYIMWTKTSQRCFWKPFRIKHETDFCFLSWRNLGCTLKWTPSSPPQTQRDSEHFRGTRLLQTRTKTSTLQVQRRRLLLSSTNLEIQQSEPPDSSLRKGWNIVLKEQSVVLSVVAGGPGRTDVELTKGKLSLWMQQSQEHILMHFLLRSCW